MPVPPTKITRPSLVIATSLENGRQAKFVKGRNGLLMVRQTTPTRPLLNEGVDPKRPDPGRRDGEVAFLGRFEFGRLPVVRDRARQFLGMRRRQDLIETGIILVVDLDGRRKVCRDEQVRPFFCTIRRRRSCMNLQTGRVPPPFLFP